MTEALQKVTREIKTMSADKYDVTAQGEDEKCNFEIIQANSSGPALNVAHETIIK